MRRPLAAGSALAIAVVITIAVVVADRGSSPRRPARRASIEEATTTAVPYWNVPVSRSAAINQVRSVKSAVTASSILTAKLMTYGDYRRASEPGVRTPETPDTLRIWAVEILGSFTPWHAEHPDYAWGIWILDAHSGIPIGEVAGPRGRPKYWDHLPDHSPPPWWFRP